MKIALLSGASSIHTIRWANGLYAAGHEVHVITQHPEIEPFDEGVRVHLFPYRGVLGYFTMASKVRRLLKKIQPDILNAHYASGYATTARLVDFHPWVLSVWGSDVYDFPYKSPLHRWLVRKNIQAADQVASTSHCMAEQTRSLVSTVGDILITPFGVDMMAYASVAPLRLEDKSALVIGTVKSMQPKYGVDILINAFALLYKKLLQTNAEVAKTLQLRLVGGGVQLLELQALAKKLNIRERVRFIGRVDHFQVPVELEKMDIYVALSRLDSESFGVAVIEAGAAARPVVVSDVGGLPEVTLDGVTGLVVPRENPQAAADALEKLIYDADLRQEMGVAGRKHVRDHYSWPACLDTMLNVYRSTIDNFLSELK